MKLTVEINGVTVPLNDCFWVLADSTGCVYASHHGDFATSVEQAHEQFTPNQRTRDRETKRGYTVHLLTHDQWRKQAKPCFLGTCEHRKQATR